jgi:hypothetical protein
MKILVFAAYKVSKQGVSAQGSCGFVLDIEEAEEFPKALEEAEKKIKAHSCADSVLLLNLTMQEWKENP